jgi:cytochrome c oxidase subunit 4
MSDDSTEAHHHPGAKTYGGVLAALLVLTIITVTAASFNFGAMNVVIALFIATVKASLVVLFFMEVRFSKPLNAMIFLGGVFFLGLFLTFCLIDTGSRPNIIPANLKVPNPPNLTPPPPPAQPR